MELFGKVVVIPQDSEYRKSFNVLVPLAIQGKECKIIEKPKSPNTQRASVGWEVEIEGRGYTLPSWAVELTKRVYPYNPSYSI